MASSFYWPSRKVLCPYCFQRFHPSDCRIVYPRPLNSPHTSLIPPPPPKDPPKGLGKLVSRFRVERLVGESNLFSAAARECPFCHKTLPSNIELAENYIIALVGLRGSGKTHFIATGIEELKSPAIAGALGVVVLPQSPEVENQYRQKYYDPVFVTKIPPPPDQPGLPPEPPLIYVLRFSGRKRKPVNLIFYDISGEDLTNADGLIDYGRYVFQASAFIVLQDPLVIKEISDQVLPAHRLPPDEFAYLQGKDVLTWISQYYRTVHGGADSISVPTAIALSKSDLLSFANHRAHYTFLDPPPYKDKWHPTLLRRDFDSVNVDVQDFLSNLPNHAGQGVLRWKSQFEKAHFFAVSATGWVTNPNPATPGFIAPIQPIRILDPLFWVLWQLNILEVK